MSFSERLKIFWIIVEDFIQRIFCGLPIVHSNKELNGQLVVITGANTGIGKETAIMLSLRGAQIIIGCRDERKAENTINEIIACNPKANITSHKLDLSSLTSVRQFSKQVTQSVDKIDILINNAGICGCPESRTVDGFEMQFGTNHLGHFLLTLLLIPLLRRSSMARIINVSSDAYKLGHINIDNLHLDNGLYTPISAYAQSKLANILFTKELAKRLGIKCNIRVCCLTPGSVKTHAYRHENSFMNRFLNLFLVDVRHGCQTTLYCALNDNIEDETGHYYKNCCRIHNMKQRARDEDMAKTLWNMSCDLVNVEEGIKF